MRPGSIVATAALLALLSGPALAEPRWLGCKFTDTSGKPQTFAMVFDDIRGTAALLDGAALVDGAQTSITFQALRTRFPQFELRDLTPNPVSMMPPRSTLPASWNT